MRTNQLLILLFGTFALFAASMRAEDSVTLDDGVVLKGKVLKEENGSVYLQQKNGETSVIDKTRIRRMEIVGSPELVDGTKPLPSAPKEIGALIGARNNSPKNLDPAWAKPRIAEMTELGSPELAKRKAALEKAKSNKDEYLLVMLAMLHPKQKTDEFTRVGILRALLDMAPLSDEAAKTVAFSTCSDPYPEARREACRTIRYLQEDRALREITRFAFTEGNTSMKQAAAAALHEIDDNRIYGMMVSAVPSPSITANYGEGQGLEQPRFVIPTGPGGLRLPIWLPSQPITGVASEIGSPVTEFLKMLARKDMGNLPYAWQIWYREKVGELGKDDRDAYYEKRSLRSKANAPTGP